MCKSAVGVSDSSFCALIRLAGTWWLRQINFSVRYDSSAELGLSWNRFRTQLFWRAYLAF